MTDCKPFLLIWFCQALVLATWKATKRHTELSLGIETYLPEPKGKLQHLPSVLTSGDVNHRRAQRGVKGLGMALRKAWEQRVHQLWLLEQNVMVVEVGWGSLA